MASQITLTGGAWTDPHGTAVANGTLVMTLSQDAVVLSNSNQIAPTVVSFPLDSNGNLVASPAPTVWGNDNLSPSGTYYTAEVLNSNNSRVWGPEKWNLTGAGPINPGTIPPTTSPPGSGITVSPLVLKTNGTLNGSQTLLNFSDTASVKWTQDGAGNESATIARTTAFYLTIDGAGNPPGTGVKGQMNVPVACTATGWVLTADAAGSAVIDVLRSTYAGFPTTSSIAGTDKPTLSAAQKNENLGPLSNWTSTALSAGDQLQFNLNSVATSTRLNLAIIVTVP